MMRRYFFPTHEKMDVDDILQTPPPDFSRPLRAGTVWLIPAHAPVHRPRFTVDPRRRYSTSCLVHRCGVHFPTCAAAVIDLRPRRNNPNGLPGGPTATVAPERLNAVVDRVLSHVHGVVVVHCRHGTNRTGLVCCAALVKSGCPVQDAISQFEGLRGAMRPNVVRSLHAFVAWWAGRPES